MTDQPTPTTHHRGSCHCGAVRFEADVDATTGSRCNCSICTKLGTTNSIIKPAAFQLTAGEAELSTYRWGGNISTRYFCKHCGVHVFGRGHLAEVGGDYVSINLLCIDELDPIDVNVIYWDGRHDNWEAGPRPEPWRTHPRGGQATA